jgi:hypothetical protein
MTQPHEWVYEVIADGPGGDMVTSKDEFIVFYVLRLQRLYSLNHIVVDSFSESKRVIGQWFEHRVTV